MSKIITIATRRSPLAIKQTEMVAEYLKGKMVGYDFEKLELVSTGDKQQNWSLEQKGGKGLFTKELEDALLDGRAQLAMHSAKDLPTELPQGLAIAGYLPREDASDTIVYRNASDVYRKIATGSPRRRSQAAKIFKEAEEWVEIRGNFQTRMKKMVDGYADATMMATAGLKRLGIEGEEGLKFERLSLKQMVPAVGQGAIALECREDMVAEFAEYLCKDTYYAVTVERTLLSAFGGGCHVAYAGHYVDGVLHVYHPDCGTKEFEFKDVGLGDVGAEVKKIVKEIKG